MSSVFKHDSAWATAGVGARNLNPGNVRCLSQDSPYESQCIPAGNNGYFAKFGDINTGIYANVDLYVRKYMGKDPDDITAVWAGSPESTAYWEAIKGCFEK